jgi:hypothetical protein
VRRPPGGEARRIEIARAQWFQCGGSSDGRGEWAGGGPAGQPAEQADQAERVGDGAVAIGHRLIRRVGPVQRVGRTGEGLRQAARTAPDRGECCAGGEAGRAQRQIERVDPGVGMGEPAGGLGGWPCGRAVSICLSDFSEAPAIPMAWPFADFTERSPLRYQRAA